MKNQGLSADQLNEELSQQNPLLMFDLRSKDQFENGHVKGSVHAVCDVRAKETIMPKIPKNVKIILISEPEEIARETAQMMKSFGLDAHYLDGGFCSWKGNNLTFSFFDIKKNSNIPNHYVCNLKFQLQTVTLMRKKYCHIHIQTVLSSLFEPKKF